VVAAASPMSGRVLSRIGPVNDPRLRGS